MKVIFTLEPADMKAFLAHNRKHGAQYKRIRYASILAFIALSLQHALAAYSDTPHRVIAFFLTFAVFALAAWLSGALLRRVAYWRSFTAREQPGLFCEHSITLADEALIEVTAVNEGRHLWSGVHSVINAASHIYIFVAANAAHIIPKRAFANPAASDAFFRRAAQLHADAHKA